MVLLFASSKQATKLAVDRSFQIDEDALTSEVMKQVEEFAATIKLDFSKGPEVKEKVARTIRAKWCSMRFVQKKVHTHMSQQGKTLGHKRKTKKITEEGQFLI